MTDVEILEQRAYLIDTINRKDREWNEYRSKYAGAPEYWEVQRNSFNEISALRSHLADLPLTSKEKKWRLVKIVSAIVVVVASLILIWTLKGISIDINFSSIFSWKSWLIISSIIAILPATCFILYKRKEDGFFDTREFYPAYIYCVSAFTVMIFLRALFTPDFTNMTFDGWTGWGLRSLVLSVVPAALFIGYMFLTENFEEDGLQAGFGLFILTFLGLMGLKTIWWLISLVL